MSIPPGAGSRSLPLPLLVLAACGGPPGDAGLRIDHLPGSETPGALIARAEDHRRFGAALAALAEHPAMEVRLDLATALGRIGDTAAADVLAALAGDPAAGVREAALFAIGLLGDEAPGSARALALERLAGGVLPGERAAAFDAAGRLLGEEQVHEPAIGLNDPSPRIRAAAARALGFLGQRGIPVPDDIVSRLAESLDDEDRRVRFMAAFALFRIAAPLPGPPAAVEALRRAAGGDEWWEVRAYALRGLARRGGLDSAALKRALADEVPAVGATAASMLGVLDARRRCELAGIALEALADRVDSERVKEVEGELAHAVRAALEAAAECEPTPTLIASASRIAAAIDNGIERPRTAGAALVLCLARQALGADDPSLVSCDPKRPYRGKRLLARRLGRAPRRDAAAEALGAMVADPDPRVALAALDALAGMDLPEGRRAVVQALGDERMLVVSGALSLIAARPEVFAPDGEGPVDDLIDALSLLVERFSPFDHAEAVLVSAAGALGALGHPACGPVLSAMVADPRPGVRNAVLAAHGSVAGLDPPSVLPPTEARRPTDPRHLERWRAADAVARVGTTRGTFRFRLRGDVAPATVESFAGLAAEGYFDGAEIHRVVPNFVVQAGDPTGTGLGDPGYSLRCEVSALPYRRGTVGMALSGKDTGGSQFFVALSSQPHLDGNYTVFGDVVEGMDVLDLIEEGDAILTVTVERGRRERITPR